MDIDTLQRVAHTYLLNLPLETCVRTLRDVLGVDVHITDTGEFKRGNNVKSYDEMHEYTRIYINWMRVDESQKVFDFIQK